MSTRERILDTAIMLFNEQGTKAVTTNHIAAAAGISPGNFYYHIRSKEDIIRAILDRMDELGDNVQDIVHRNNGHDIVQSQL